jgi:DNA-directed RNA polymerase subunit RPC12/RpoP
MVEWICMKCGNKWKNETKEEPRQCPMCGSCTIYVPKIIKKK